MESKLFIAFHVAVLLAFSTASNGDSNGTAFFSMNSCENLDLETDYPNPYKYNFTNPFEPGQDLIVKGRTSEDSVRFTVDLGTSDINNAVPLHISVRFDEGKIVFNSFVKGRWGNEERKSNPWERGDDIEFLIRTQDSNFQIYADQKEIKEYEHRVPVSSLSSISVNGDLIITHIHVGDRVYPIPYESG
uniref:Galectin n=1 Tax=Panagrolaimus sp. ES5 TaxID=591445 RepID=A0AC34FA44_9BILA